MPILAILALAGLIAFAFISRPKHRRAEWAADAPALMVPSPLWQGFVGRPNTYPDNLFHELLNAGFGEKWSAALPGRNGVPMRTYEDVIDYYGIQYVIEDEDRFYWTTEPKYQYEDFMARRAVLVNEVLDEIYGGHESGWTPGIKKTKVYRILPKHSTVKDQIKEYDPFAWIVGRPTR